MNNGISLWDPVEFAHNSTVALSLLTLNPLALFSFNDAKVVFGKAFQLIPVSSAL